MSDTTSRGFGLLIAYILPGFIVLIGLSTLSPAVHRWLMGSEMNDLAVGGVLYVTAASIAIGMVLNVFRWLFIDALHHATGLNKPQWDDSTLAERLSAFERLVEDHFRYYQFYGNSALALVLAFACWRASPTGQFIAAGFAELALITLEIALLAASRDALQRYYTRTSILLGQVEETAMTNGSHPKPNQPKKPDSKAEQTRKASGGTNSTGAKKPK